VVRRLVIVGVFVLVLAFIGYAVFWPCWIEPVAWTPEPNPGMTGVYAPNTALAGIERLAEGIVGPEDVELGPDGWIYATLRDGRIIRFDPQHPDSFATFANTHGFPLGLEFDAQGELIVADGDRGLLTISLDGAIRVLLEQVDGARMRFPDDLAITHDGTIWFSDAYTRGPADLQFQAWEGVSSGRVIAFDPASKRASVHLDGLMFANGMTLGPNDEYVLVTELFGARVVRLWLTGPKRGTHDVFMRALPGYPDNIAYDGAGMFWLALVSTRTPSFERWSRYPFLRAFAAKAPGMRAPHPIPSFQTHDYCGWVVGVDTTGTVRFNLQSPPGGYGAITSANAFDGYLYVGSIRMTAVGRIALAGLRPVSNQ
jgi:sugar lactone lactonase YvrE